MTTAGIPTPHDIYQEAFQVGQVQAISNLIADIQKVLVAHHNQDAWQALQEASYAVNRALQALQS